jgi:hypothetical protein
MESRKAAEAAIKAEFLRWYTETSRGNEDSFYPVSSLQLG